MGIDIPDIVKGPELVIWKELRVKSRPDPTLVVELVPVTLVGGPIVGGVCLFIISFFSVPLYLVSDYGVGLFCLAKFITGLRG